MEPLRLSNSLLVEEEHNIQQVRHKFLPLTFIRDIKFFFDISYDDVNQLLIEVERIKEAKRRNEKKRLKIELLTSKEKEVFNLVVQGLSTKLIAKKLFVQPTTISTHRKRIKQKLEFETAFDWFSFAKASQ